MKSAERTTKHYITFVSLVLVFLVILSTEARAELYGFAPISNNSGVSAQMAQQLSLEVVDLGATGTGGVNRVEFIFNNNIAPYAVDPGLDGVIRLLAFEDGTLLGLAVINPYPNLLDSGSTVVFEEDLSPPNGFGGLDFDVTQNFYAVDADPPPPKDGVNPYEAVGIEFDLIAGQTFADVLAALNQGFTGPIVSGESLRIGIHVISIGEESDAFILIPVPGAVILGMLGLGVAGLKLRKFA